MEDVGIFYEHFVYFATIWYIEHIAIWYILWSFGTFSPFWDVAQRKIWQPCAHVRCAALTRLSQK
jgi:hypothetical protein